MQCVWVLILFLPSALSQRFSVKGPDAPVVGVAGSDVVLPCSVREPFKENMMNAENLTVTWSRSDLRDSLVHLYKNYKDLNTDQIPSYRGRTAVFKEELKNGNVSLILSNVRITDEGEYTCTVDSDSWRSSVPIKLSVEVIGSEPVITVEKYESGKLSLLCESKGWRPAPDLQWLNSKGVNLTADEKEIQQVSDLYNVKRRMTVKDSDIDSFSCRVTQKNHVQEEHIRAATLLEHVPNPGRTAGIILAVLLLLGLVGFLAGAVLLYIKRLREIHEVTSLLNSGRDACLLHHNLSDRQWDHVVKTLLKPGGDERLLHQNLSDRQSDHPEEILLKPKEERKEFNLRKFDPSDRGVQKLQRVIAASTHVQLVDCNLSEISCAALAEVLRSNNSLIELNLSENRLKDTGVKILCDGLKKEYCKLQILRLEECNLSERSCEDLVSVLQSENSTLIELNLNQNKLKDSGVKKLCEELKSKNCKLQKLRLEECDLTEESCVYLSSVLQSVNSTLIELNLNRNKLQDTGVYELCEGLKNNNKLQKLSLEECDLTERSCGYLASVLRSNNSLIELNLSQNILKDSGVKILCDELKNENCKLQKLSLEQCDLSEGSCEYLASVLQSENSTLIELNLNMNFLQDAGVKILCDGLKNNKKLQILKLEECDLSERYCEYLASVLQSENSTLIELNLTRNELQDAGVKILCDGLKNNKKLQILSLEHSGLTERSCEYLVSVLQSENSTLIELNLTTNFLQDAGVQILCDGLKNNKKLQKLKLAGCSITDTGCTDLTEALLQQTPPLPLPLKELDLRRNPITETGKIHLNAAFPDLKVIY